MSEIFNLDTGGELIVSASNTEYLRVSLPMMRLTNLSVDTGFDQRTQSKLTMVGLLHGELEPCTIRSKVSEYTKLLCWANEEFFLELALTWFNTSLSVESHGVQATVELETYGAPITKEEMIKRAMGE
jgi:hypothetical protein